MAAGDPGLFSGLGKLAKPLGGIVGKIGGKALGFIPGVGTALSIASMVGPGLFGAAKGLLQKTGMSAAAAGTTAAVGGALAAGTAGVGAFELGKAAVKGAEHMFGGGKRRRRRMHVTNVRALRRSIRRLHGFEKLARKVMVVHHYKRVGHVRIGHARGRKAA